MLLRTTGLLGLLTLLLSPSALAGTLFVDANLTTGLNDGSSWADAFQGPDGLQAALVIAVAGDRVFAAQGTYRPTSTGSRTESFRPLDNVEVYGGFVGTEAAPAERPPFGTAPSIMSGDLLGDDNSGGSVAENSNHVIRGNGVGPSAIIDGFTVSGGNANSTGGNNDRGGGIICGGGSSPTLRNCLFTLSRCTFGGGAGYVTASTSAPSFSDCQFIDNLGGSFGGAFDIAQAGNVRYERCRFRGNSAARAGALEIFSTGGVVVSNCEFVDNTASGGSGGGAFWIGSGGNTTIVNCSVVDNHSLAQNIGGIRVSGATVTVSNSIIWNNTGPGGAHSGATQVDAAAGVTWSLVEGGFGGAGNVSGDPQFQDQVGGDLSLTATSPAIDAGSNGLVVTGVTLDLARNPRFVDQPSVPDTGSGTAPIVDMGALELAGGSPVTVFCAGDGGGAACPCSNTGAAGHGCGNGTFAAGAQLAGSGSASVSNDTLTLTVTQSTPGAPGVFFQGDNVLAGGNGVAFGDGLMCTGSGICRIQVAFADGSGSASSSISISVKCSVLAGQRKRMQWWYRDAALSPCGNGFNVSNGVEAIWLP
jgi:hypothetical protein